MQLRGIDTAWQMPQLNVDQLHPRFTFICGSENFGNTDLKLKRQIYGVLDRGLAENNLSRIFFIAYKVHPKSDLELEVTKK